MWVTDVVLEYRPRAKQRVATNIVQNTRGRALRAIDIDLSG